MTFNSLASKLHPWYNIFVRPIAYIPRFDSIEYGFPGVLNAKQRLGGQDSLSVVLDNGEQASPRQYEDKKTQKRSWA